MTQPDFAQIQMLMDIVHNSIDLPGTSRIRKAAMDELAAIEADLQKQADADAAAAKAQAEQAAANPPKAIPSTPEPAASTSPIYTSDNPNPKPSILAGLKSTEPTNGQV